MTTEQAIAELEERFKVIEDAEHFFPCVEEAHRKQVERIFELGMGAEGMIGQYNSTNPLYVNPSTSPKGFTPKGKGDRKKKDRKTRFFDSYKDYRQFIGREASFVNLRLSEFLKLDFMNSLERNENGWATGIKSSANAGKVEGSVDKYGVETWQLTEQEHRDFAECCKKKRLEVQI